MKFKINNEEIELVYSFRSSIYFEQIAGHNLDFTNLTANDLLTLFYSVFIASMQKAKKPIVSMLDFMDAIDENGGDKILLEFSNWYVQTLQAQYEVLNSEDEKEKKPVKKTGKKKTN